MENESLFREFDAQKRTVSELRINLNELRRELDPLFNKKKETGQSIRELLQQVKRLREERDKLTIEVKEHKIERARQQEVVRARIESAKELQKKRDDVQKKHGIRGNPAQFKHEIEKIEYRIQTEGMSFANEQKLMKNIKELQKKVEEAAVVSDVWEQTHAVEKEINELKKKSDEAHKIVQKKADESQKKHEEMITLLKEVDELRKNEKKMNFDIDEMKKKYEDVKKKLEEELLKLSEMGKKVGEFQSEGKRKKNEEFEQQLASKSQSVEEKLKRGEKLTTQDLLAWQMKER